jgi:zinc protease
MNTKKTIVFLLAFVFLMTTTGFTQKSDKIPSIKYQEFTLPNGLRVIMHEDRSTPIVAVNVWYHVGSKNEVAGRTGFAHLFEHMMFQGSKNYNNDYFKPLQEAGANINGSTNVDRTNYFEVVPSNFLELALFMEADRMGGLLDAMTMEKLDNQRDVVKNERRQNYDNQPYGTAYEKIQKIMYAPEHPYSWTTIGSLEDLTNASMDDVKGFFRQYYVPNNASLVIAGDFNPKEARKLVEKHFGGIAKGAPITRPNPAAPKLDKEIRTTFEDSVQLPRLYMVWHAAPRFTQDEAVLDILASILSNGRGSRLQSNLVYDKQLAQTIFASNPASEIAGQFQVVATARPGKTLDEIEKEINAEVERIKQQPPTAEELSRALTQLESSSIYGLQTVLGKADQMNGYATFLNKPDSFADELEKYRKVTPADVQKAAQTFLTDKRLVMSFVPRPKDKEAPQMNSAVNKSASTVAKKEKTAEDTSKLPVAGPNPKFTLPAVEKTKLSNGLEVWLVKQAELPIVSMNLVLKSGQAADPKGLSGLAGTTASLLDDGTKTRTAIDIGNQVQDIGAQLNTGSGWDNSNVRMLTLTKNFDKALDIFSDVVLNAQFPDAEVENYRRRTLGGLLQRRDSPEAIADVVYSRVLYGENHPYGASLNETSVKAVKREDVLKFYETYYRPNNAVLIVVGDADMKSLTPKLEASFKNWKAGDVPQMKISDVAAREKSVIYLVDKPNAAQSVIAVGQVGAPRSTEDFIALQVMNTILGGGFTSRINMNLREDKGYTYGARSGFSWRRGAGPFSANAPVQSFSTKESVMEIMKELGGIRGAIPITARELDYNKQSLIRRFPAGFETVDQIASQLSNMVVYDLPATYYNDYISKVNAVTMEDVNRVANKYLTPDKMAVVVVGDRKTIEAGLKEIEGLGSTIVYLDAEGNPIK